MENTAKTGSWLAALQAALKSALRIFRRRFNIWTVMGYFLLVALTIFSFSGTGFTQTQTVLQDSNFSYLGIIKVHGVGYSAQGLACRRSTNTCFIIGNSGLPPYHLYEISLPSPSLTWAGAGQSSVVKDWGNLNQYGVLTASGSLIAMKALWWDEPNQRLYFSYGSFYANGKDNPVFGYATFINGVLAIHGPWKVLTQSDTSKGSFKEAPAALQAITGRRFLMFGTHSSTSQNMSWGAGLVSVADPDATGVLAGGTVDSAKIIHYPMLHTTINGVNDFYSDFPVPKADQTTSIFIHGDDNVGLQSLGKAQGGSANTITLAASVNFNTSASQPYFNLASGFWYVTNTDSGEQLRIIGGDDVTKIATVETNWTKGVPVAGTNYSLYVGSYEQAVPLPLSLWSTYDAMFQFSWIDLPTKHGLVYFGFVPAGYYWYGNPKAHDDPHGIPYNNFIDSIIYPGQKVDDHLRPTSRGAHSEALGSRWYILDPSSVVATAQKIKNNTATAADLEIPWTYSGPLDTLGGSVILQNDQVPGPSDQYWDPVARNLYLLYSGMVNGFEDSAIQVWHVTDGTDGFPTILQQPTNQTINQGQSANFSVVAAGTPPLFYQWQMLASGASTWADIASANQAAYATPATVISDNNSQFRCRVSNSSGSATSSDVTLTVIPAGNAPPSIQQQPANQTVNEGQSANFSVVAAGTPPLSYQWQKLAPGASTWADIASANQAAYTTPTAVVSDNNTQFRCQVGNQFGSTVSSGANLTVSAANGPPSISQQPQDVVLSQGPGEDFVFSIKAQEAISYQWQRQDMGSSSFIDIPGASGDIYTDIATVDIDEASFRCVAMNSVGKTISSSAALHLPGVLVIMQTGDTVVNFHYDHNNIQADLKMTLPAGSFPVGKPFKVSRADQLSDGKAQVGHYYKHTGVGLNFLSWGQEPQSPAQFVLTNIQGLSLDTKNKFTLARYDSAADTWLAVPTSLQGSVVTSVIDHFSIYALMQIAAANDLNSVKVYPNPFRPSQGHTTITFANMPAGTRLRFYTLAGEKVKELNADSTGTAVWDGSSDAGRHMASGVYFGVLEGNGQKKILNVAIQR